MALSEVTRVETVRKRCEGWPALEVSPSVNGPPPAASWRTLASAADIPRGERLLVRRPGEERASFRVYLPAIAPPPEPEPEALQAVAAPQQDALGGRLDKTLEVIQDSTMRLTQTMGLLAANAEKMGLAMQKHDDTREKLAEALSALQTDRQAAAVINNVTRYVDIILGGLAVKMGVLPVDKWTFFKESLELHAVVKANGLEVSDVVTLIQEYARQRDMQTA